MKNSILTSMLLLTCLITMVGCGGPELKEVKGLVAGVEIDNDTLKSAKVVVEGDTMLFRLADTRFVNGMMVHGDSVKISYIEGRKDTLKALLVDVLPKAAHYVNPKDLKNDSLITAPAK